MTKGEAISYLFKDCKNCVKDTKTGILWFGRNFTAITSFTVIPIEVWNQVPDSIFEVVV